MEPFKKKLETETTKENDSATVLGSTCQRPETLPSLEEKAHLEMTREKLQEQLEALTTQIQGLKVTEAQRVEKTLRESFGQMKENLMRELAARAADVDTICLHVPPHQLRLLTHFVELWQGCKINLWHREEKVMLAGSEKECFKAKQAILQYLRDIAEDQLDVSNAVTKILATARGVQFLSSLEQNFSKCSLSLDVDGCCIRCAALSKEDLWPLLDRLYAAFGSRVCKVTRPLLEDARFVVLTANLEEILLVKITQTLGDTDSVLVEGVAEEMEEAAREVDTFTSLNSPGRIEFRIPGTLEGKACKEWFAAQLDDAKQIILKNGEILTEEGAENGYRLIFQCRQEKLQAVLCKLNDIKYGIVSASIDLLKAYRQQSERTLLVSGLLDYGKDRFCAMVGQTLKGDNIHSLLDIRLPSPDIENAEKEDVVANGARLQGAGLVALQSDQFQPFYVPAGQCKIFVMEGDVSSAQTDVAVNIIGKDVDMRKTASGRAFYQVCPLLQQELLFEQFKISRMPQLHLVVSQLTELPKLVMHAVLQKLDSPAKEVERLMTDILSETEKRKLCSVSLTPLGLGNRFAYDSREVAEATVKAIDGFLQDGSRSMKEIVLFINDRFIAEEFSTILTQKIGPVIPLLGVIATRDPDIGHSPTADPNAAGVYSTERLEERFELLICTMKGQNTLAIKATALEDLRSNFLYHETERDLPAFEKLASGVQREILDYASQNNVEVTKTESGLRLCGQRMQVRQIRALVREKMLQSVVERSREGWARRKAYGLPVDTDHLPGYWRYSEHGYETAIRLWHQSGPHTVEVTAEERHAVEKVFMATWRQDVVGVGNDSLGMVPHTVQVVKVERLENPVLWRAYSSKRELLFNSLTPRSRGPCSTQCTPVEHLTGSRGPVLTTSNIDRDGPLDRDIYQEINEHYLFHGTKPEIITKIFTQGLDFRLCERGMLGRGVYAAESSTKSNQYADDRDNRSYNREFVMFLMRVVLGEPYLNTEARPDDMLHKFSRPPCRNCKLTKCLCLESRLYNSLIDNTPSEMIRIFREFVLYDQDVCYPEYLITYRRVRV